MRHLLLTALLLVSVGVQAGFTDGNTLLRDCESDDAQGLVCLGYLKGAADLHGALHHWGDLKSKQWCMPNGVTAGQLQLVVIKYLRARPEVLHLEASSAVANAFIKAFPCAGE